MLRLAVITKTGVTYSLNAEDRETLDNYLLELDEKEGLKCYRIICKETQEIIEKWYSKTGE